MSGGTITRIVGGKLTKEIEGDYTIWTDNYIINSGGKISFTSDEEIIFGSPPTPPPAGKYFDKGWWTDENDKEIKEALIGQRVKFHIQMDKSKVPAGSKIEFTLMDWDGILNSDDPITLTSTTKDPKTNTFPEIKEMITDANGKASLYVTLTDGLVQFTEDDGGNEIELYFDCTYYDKSDKETEKLDLPAEEFNYLIVYEKEVLITVFVELPHSKYSIFKKGQFFSALGLAGHSAMAIGEQYFDYGPDYYTPTIDEKKYDYDFNDDGDKDDSLNIKREKIYDKQGQQIGEKGVLYDDKGTKISDLDHTFAPGRPWWGEMIAQNKGIDADQIKLQNVLDFISLDWRLTIIYGEVNKIEFYVKESEANKMLNWWKTRYKNLKAYSTMPWTGEQCTTTVKTAIQQAYPFNLGKVINRISDDTQMPSGLLLELRKFISSSKQNFGKPSQITIIKNESVNFTP